MWPMPQTKGGWCIPISVGRSGARASVASSHASRASQSSPCAAPGTTVSSITTRTGMSSIAYCTNPPSWRVPGRCAIIASRLSWLPGIGEHRHVQPPRDHLAEQRVRAGLPEIGKIAGDEHEVGRRVQPCHRAQRALGEHIGLHYARRPEAARPAMQVSDLDDEHRRS